MVNVITSIFNFSKKLVLNEILPELDRYIKGFIKVYKALDDKQQAVIDALVVSRSLLFYHFLNLLAVIFFWFLPQGKDILYSAIEDSVASQFGTAFWLTISTLVWGICAEFAARFRVYAKDNSGLVLSQQRVEWRRMLQRFYASAFLIFPFVIMIVGCFLAANNREENMEKAWGSASILLAFLFVGLILAYNLYFNPKWQNSFLRIFSGIKPVDDYNNSEEKRLKESLLGIYNPFVFRFNNEIKDDCRLTIKDEWYDMPLEQLPEEIRDYPYNEKFPRSIKPPIDHGLVELKAVFFPAKAEEGSIQKDVFIRWVYHINYRFYPVLNRELKFVVFTGLAILFIVPFLPISMYEHIGSAGLVAFSFAGWIALSTGLLFLDISNFFKNRILNIIPWRFCLIIWMILISIYNTDHPARFLNADTNAQSDRPDLQKHFHEWLNKRVDTSSVVLVKDSLCKKDSLGNFIAELRPKKEVAKVPILFVCAEGGALRTGAMAASLLGHLQDSMTWFKDRIYAFSTVSGGTVGVGFFNAVTYLSKYDPQKIKLKKLINRWFTKDYLAPVVAKLFYGDILQLFVPFHVYYFDRSIALEMAWENGYDEIDNGRYESNVFSSDFLKGGRQFNAPAWFINTTQVETGHQCWISNVKPSGVSNNSDTFSNLELYNRDVLSNIPGTLRYSTAMGFSTRFPLISPAAAVTYNFSRRYHFVDGGYVENTGSQTMLEILIALSKDVYFQRHCVPFVMMIRFGPDDILKKPEPVTFGSEWNEVLSGIMNTRAGRSELARNYLIDYVKKLRIENILSDKKDTCAKNPAYYARMKDSIQNKLFDWEVTFEMAQRKVPMNWVLSNKSMERVEEYCRELLLDTVKTRRFINQIKM